jgi:hypothetical protein
MQILAPLVDTWHCRWKVFNFRAYLFSKFGTCGSAHLTGILLIYCRYKTDHITVHSHLQYALLLCTNIVNTSYILLICVLTAFQELRLSAVKCGVTNGLQLESCGKKLSYRNVRYCLSISVVGLRQTLKISRKMGSFLLEVLNPYPSNIKQECYILQCDIWLGELYKLLRSHIVLCITIVRDKTLRS